MWNAYSYVPGQGSNRCAVPASRVRICAMTSDELLGGSASNCVKLMKHKAFCRPDPPELSVGCGTSLATRSVEKTSLRQSKPPARVGRKASGQRRNRPDVWATEATARASRAGVFL